MLRALLCCSFLMLFFTACKKEEISKMDGLVVYSTVGESTCERYQIEIDGETYVPEYLKSAFQMDSLEVRIDGFLQNNRRYVCEEDKFKTKVVQINVITLR